VDEWLNIEFLQGVSPPSDITNSLPLLSLPCAQNIFAILRLLFFCDCAFFMQQDARNITVYAFSR